MQGVWTITYNGSEQAAAAWGLTARPVIRTRDRSPTQISFRMAGADPASAVPFPFQAQVIIKHYSAWNGLAGGWTGLLYTFTGYQAAQSGDLSGHGQGINLVFKDAIWLMQNTTFQQLWTIASTPSNPDYISRCVLFMDINSWEPNTYQSVQWQVTQIIAYAAECGIAIAPGTIDYSGWFLNYYHCRAVSCWEAILKCLEPIPDAKVWVDGSQNPPVLNVRTRANLAALPAPTATAPGPITLIYKGTDSAGRRHFSTQSFTPRYDLIPPQVVIQYQINNTFNGKSSPTFTNDVWPLSVNGNSDGQMPFAQVCPMDLTGAAITTQTGTLDSQPLMVTSAQTGYSEGSPGDHAIKRQWWSEKRGGETEILTDWRVRFGSATISDATVVDDYGNPINLAQYPNRICAGSYHAWMAGVAGGIYAIRAHIKVTVQYTQYDAPGSTPAETDTNGNVIRKAATHDLHAHVTLTNSPAGLQTYVGKNLTALAETPVPNLAQNVFNSRAMLDYDGSHEIIDPGITNGKNLTAPLTQIIGHWNVLNFTGGNPLWATANMTISGTEIDLVTNHIKIEVGPSKHLQPQDWNSMLQFFRYRRLYIDSAVRATGYASANNNVDMPLNTADGNTVPGLNVDQQQAILAPDATNTGVSNLISKDATTGQTTVVQQTTGGTTPIVTALHMVELSGAGAPSTSTLA